MNQSNLLLNIFFKAMFGGKDVVYKGKKFPLGKLKGLRRYDVGNLLFIEQNPAKKTIWAKMTREGHKILWVIDTKFNRYLVRMVDGKITRLRGPSGGER